MKKFMKRSLAVLLVLLLCSGSFVCFAADTEKAYFDYDTYVLLGDSVASGHNDLTYIDSEFTRVEGSYAALVADELGAELIPMACPGFRTIEIRYMLEDDFEGDEYLFHDAHDPEVGRFINADDTDYLGYDKSPISMNLFVTAVIIR